MKRILLTVLVAAAMPLAAQAGDLDYSYLQAGYQATNFNNAPDVHGWGGTGSAALGPNFQAFGGYARQSIDQTDLHLNDWNLGGGFHTAINASTDFVTNVDYRQLDVSGVSGDTRTYSGEVGVRSALAPQFEGWVLAGYEDGHNVNGEGYGKIGGQFKFNKNWGLVGEAKLSHDTKEYTVGPRFSF